MPIDNCTSSFSELATSVLPQYMEKLRGELQRPHTLAAFCISGVGVSGILKTLEWELDFSGCYVLMHDGIPFYVGISRSVIKRLRQHGTGKTHFNASLAYRMAKEKVTHTTTRSNAMEDPSFRAAFDDARTRLRGCTVAFIEISNPLELYLFEAYCAMALDTCEWNTFRTH